MSDRRRIRTAILGTFGLVLCLAAPVRAVDTAIAPSERDLIAHFTCEALAARRMLGAAQARTCAEVFTRIKLGFVPAAGDFATMDPRDWADVHRAGYAAYRDWVSHNPDRVAQARRKALELVEGGGTDS